MASRKQHRIRVGIGGWTYEPWRGTFYPPGLAQKRELEYASRQLSSIEINGTFYGTQRSDSFARWYDETPDGFVFALKAPRYATHRRVLADARESVERFFESGVMRLKEKLGPTNWQFPTTKPFNADDFEAFLSLLPQQVDGQPIRHAVEVRHESFQTPDFVALARRYGVAVVLAGDAPYPQIADLTAPFVYARVMGTTESEALGYSDVALELWAERARQWAAGSVPHGLNTVADAPRTSTQRDVFLYVISGFKVRNPAAAIALIERLSRSAQPRAT